MPAPAAIAQARVYVVTLHRNPRKLPRQVLDFCHGQHDVSGCAQIGGEMTETFRTALLVFPRRSLGSSLLS